MLFTDIIAMAASPAAPGSTWNALMVSPMASSEAPVTTVQAYGVLMPECCPDPAKEKNRWFLNISTCVGMSEVMPVLIGQ